MRFQVSGIRFQGSGAGVESPLPSGRGREAMTYGRGHFASQEVERSGAAVSHLAELVRGKFLASRKPLIRPFGPPSPQGEKG